MFANLPHANQGSTTLRSDLLLVVLLVGLGVLARLVPHALNFSPIAASALFAGVMLRHRPLALLVPGSALLISNLALGFDEWRVATVVYAALTLPVFAGFLVRRYRLAYSVLPAALSCSLIFYTTTNLAVWAFSGLYPLDTAGLIQCYVAALPFFKQTVAGDLFWTVVLFGGAFLVQHLHARTAPARIEARR
jgi:hypothetical protein